jgi:hypothetical protein
MVRLAASLERVPAMHRIEVGDWLLERLRRPAEKPHGWWALGRVGARQSLYGSAHQVVPPESPPLAAGRAGARLEAVEPAAFAATQIARLTGDRARDLPDPSAQRCWRASRDQRQCHLDRAGDDRRRTRQGRRTPRFRRVPAGRLAAAGSRRAHGQLSVARASCFSALPREPLAVTSSTASPKRGTVTAFSDNPVRNGCPLSSTGDSSDR